MKKHGKDGRYSNNRSLYGGIAKARVKGLKSMFGAVKVYAYTYRKELKKLLQAK